jgi:hypothetical protein
MTIAESARLKGFAAHLLIRGRPVTTNAGESLTVIVEDVSALLDPDQPAQSQLPVYTQVTAAAGAVTDPRAVNKFTEADGRWHKVLTFNETRGNLVTWQWKCEAQRQ